ncbi:MAG TPA: LuxR C-terminal-related transcriptional regulator [Cellulomonas sp.]
MTIDLTGPVRPEPDDRAAHDEPATPLLLGVPQVPTWHVPRTLLRDPFAADASLVLVHGPAGSGKSMALAAWARSALPSDRAVVWLDLTVGTTPGSLWGRLRATLAEAGLLEPAQEMRGAAGRAARVAEDLAGLTRPVTVVLDGYQAVGGAEVDAALVRALRGADRLQVAVATRSDPVRLRTEGELVLDLVEVGPAELRFDRGEVAALLAHAEVQVRAEAVETVRAGTDGLAIAVRAVAIVAAHRDPDLTPERAGELAAAVAHGVVEMLATDRAGSAYLAAARRASVAEVLTPELAAALAPDLPGSLLDRFEADGLGAWQEESAGPVFVLTPVVRGALRSELDRADPGAVDGLLRVVMAQAIEADQPYRALRAAIETRDLDLVTVASISVWAVGEERDVAEVIVQVESLPLPAVAARPLLAMMLAVFYNSRAEHRVRALEWFALAAGAFGVRALRAEPAERVVLRTGESAAMRLLGRGRRAASAAHAALDQLAVLRPGQDATVDALATMMHRHLGISLVAGGEIAAGTRAIEHSLALDRPGTPSAFTSLGLLAGFAAAQGEMAAARSLAAAAAQIEPPARLDMPYARAPLELARIHLAIEDGDLARAADLLRAMEVELRTNEFWPAFAEVQATVDLWCGRAAAGAEALSQTMRRGLRAPATAAWRARLVAARAVLALAAGQSERARTLLQDLPADCPAARTTRARVLLSTGRVAEGTGLLASPDLPEEGDRSRVARRLMLATVAAADGRQQVALSVLREAAALVAAGGSRTAWLLLTAPERDRLRDLAHRSGDRDLRVLLAGADDIPAPLRDGDRTVDLTERELVVLRHLADGTELAALAVELHVSHNTVKSQVRSVYRKLGVRSRADAVSRARELGLL